MENKENEETIGAMDTAELPEGTLAHPPTQSRTLVIGLIAVAAFLTPLFLYIAYEAVFNVFEKTPPRISFKDAPRAIGTVPVRFSFLLEDSGAGVQSYTIRTIQDQKAKIIESAELPEVETIEKSIILDAEKLKLHNGEAVIEIRANDNARKKNEFIVSQKISVDLNKPEINIFLTPESIMMGESTLIAVEAKEENLTSLTVRGEHRSFPFLKATRLDSTLPDSLYVSLIAFNEPLRIVAEDFAGNITSKALPFSPVKRSASEVNVAPQDTSDDNTPGYERLKRNDDATLQGIFERFSDVKLKSVEIPKEPIATPLLFSFRDVVKKGRSSVSISDGIFYKSYTHDERVASILPGDVVAVGDMPFYGHYVIVNHGLGIFSLYGNLKESSVREGQVVRKADVLGFTGASSSYGIEGLYFSLYASGAPMDPSFFLNTQTYIKAVPKKIGALKKKLGIEVSSPLEK